MFQDVPKPSGKPSPVSESVIVWTHCHNKWLKQSTNSCKNRLDKFWSDMGARKLHMLSPSTTNTWLYIPPWVTRDDNHRSMFKISPLLWNQGCQHHLIRRDFDSSSSTTLISSTSSASRNCWPPRHHPPRPYTQFHHSQHKRAAHRDA